MVEKLRLLEGNFERIWKLRVVKGKLLKMGREQFLLYEFTWVLFNKRALGPPTVRHVIS